MKTKKVIFIWTINTIKQEFDDLTSNIKWEYNIIIDDMIMLDKWIEYYSIIITIEKI